jgi:hypothetical protein
LRFAIAFAAIAVAACATSALARAAVRVSGTASHLVVDAKDATMPEILSGIQSALNTKVTLSGSTSRQFTGVYSGSVRRVLSRLLDGTSHIVTSRDSELTIILLASGGPQGGPKTADQAAPINSSLPAHQTAPAAVQAANRQQDPDAGGAMGWTGMPTELPPARPPRPGPVAVNVAASEPPDNGPMGWTGTPSELPPRPAGQNVASAQLAEPEPQAIGPMGWTGMPSELPPRPAASSSASAPVAAPEPVDSGVQGWQGTPSELPARPHS